MFLFYSNYLRQDFARVILPTRLLLVVSVFGFSVRRLFVEGIIKWEVGECYWFLRRVDVGEEKCGQGVQWRCGSCFDSINIK